jgi:hypothetical protein
VWLSSTGTGNGSGAGGNSPARRAARSSLVLIADQRDTPLVHLESIIDT